MSRSPRTVISPVGLSIFDALGVKPDEFRAGREAQQLEELLRRVGDDPERSSAELATLGGLKLGEGDRAVFLATDTDAGERAARFNAALARRRFAVDADVQRVAGLVLDDSARFRREGVPALATALDRALQDAADRGSDAVLSVGGGIKPVVPYVAMYGMLRGLRITYTFERTGDLIELPPLPIGFDWNAVALAAGVLRDIEAHSAVGRHVLESRLGEQLSKMEGLFEQIGDEVMPSAFGLMLFKSLETAQKLPVMLSGSARRALDGALGVERRISDAMLDRVRNPLVRAQKVHTFHGTDLDVYKPPRSPERLAYWVERDMVHVAEIYTDHDRYEHDLPNRQRNQYRREEFTAYWPENTGAAVDDPAADEGVAALRRELEESERRFAQALRRAEEADRQCEEALRVAADEEAGRRREEESRRSGERERADLTARIDQLERQRRTMASWGLVRRIRWAFGREREGG
jgi:putative CRISPR-associated protein (TIGR02619 family)